MKTPAGLHGVANGLLRQRTVAVMNHLLGEDYLVTYFNVDLARRVTEFYLSIFIKID